MGSVAGLFHRFCVLSVERAEWLSLLYSGSGKCALLSSFQAIPPSLLFEPSGRLPSIASCSAQSLEKVKPQSALLRYQPLDIYILSSYISTYVRKARLTLVPFSVRRRCDDGGCFKQVAVVETLVPFSQMLLVD